MRMLLFIRLKIFVINQKNDILVLEKIINFFNFMGQR